MKISTQAGGSRQWSTPVEVVEIVWFKGLNWGYAHDKNGLCIPGALTKEMANGGQTHTWMRISELEIKPTSREVVASTGG